MRVKRSQKLAVLGDAEPSTSNPMQVAIGVRAIPLIAKPMVTVGPDHAIWRSPDETSRSNAIKAFAERVTTDGAFVLLDAPAGIATQPVEAELKRLGCVVKSRSAVATDAVVPALQVDAEQVSNASIEEVVCELASEVQGLTSEQRELLDDLLDDALTGAGL